MKRVCDARWIGTGERGKGSAGRGVLTSMVSMAFPLVSPELTFPLTFDTVALGALGGLTPVAARGSARLPGRDVRQTLRAAST